MGADPFIGEITIFAGNFAPMGWLFCDGSELPIVQYQALYSLIGTYYGGNGTTTFKLPDLRGRVPMGYGNGPSLTPRQIGASGGAEKVAIAANEMPAHSHTVQTTLSGTVTARINASPEAGGARSPAERISRTTRGLSPGPLPPLPSR